MNTRLRTAACLMAALWLTACGGGSGSNATTADRCELPLQYADGRNAGYIITDSLTESVPRKFNTCPLRTLQSARLSLCLVHPKISELQAQMRLPDSTTITLDLSNATAGASCLITGQLFSMPVPISALQNFGGLSGDWSVGVIDTDHVSPTAQGYLVGWSMQVEGLK